MKSKYPDLYFREVSESFRDIINLKCTFNDVVKQENGIDTNIFLEYGRSLDVIRAVYYDGRGNEKKLYIKDIKGNVYRAYPEERCNYLIGNMILDFTALMFDIGKYTNNFVFVNSLSTELNHDYIVELNIGDYYVNLNNIGSDNILSIIDDLNSDKSKPPEYPIRPPKNPSGSTEPIGISKHSLLVKLFGSDYKKSESWVKWYHLCDAYSNDILNIYICSNGDMVNIKYTEPKDSNSGFYFDLVKEGDTLTNDLLTVEKDFDKLTHIVDAIMKGEFKPSNSPYDKYWLELERVKVNEIVSDHQKVKDFFDKLDQRWYDYSVMYNEAMSGVVGFTSLNNKLAVVSGDELQKTIKKMKLNNSLMSLLGVVKDDEIIKSIVLDRYGVKVNVDRSKL